MRKIELEVPENVEYISDWEGYRLPEGHCIVDKGVTGCGYTEFCLTNRDNVVLCSPRKLLLENKLDQHQGDRTIFYVNSDNIDKNDRDPLIQLTKDHLAFCRANSLPTKFMVTYDSVSLVIDVLREKGLLENFKFVVDEMQSIFLDSHFKAEVESDFIEYLQECPNVIYLSATPMLDKYLELLDEFKDLDFYHLSWKNSKYTETVNVQRKRTSTLSYECKKIISEYLEGKFPMRLDLEKTPVYSKEAVFYFNSLTDITRIIKSTGLSPYQADVICSDTEDNRKKLAKIGFKISKVPLRDEPRKMFTFCTRSVYIGADFYSPCASSYIFADPNYSCLALDISLDLPQIIGRQRLKENLFKNDITIFYKIISGQNLYDRAEFDAALEEKRLSTQALLSAFDKVGDGREKEELIYKFIDSISVSKYSRDFVSISKKQGVPVYNRLIDLAYQRAWEVSQREYQDSITVTRSITKLGYVVNSEANDEKEAILGEFKREFLEDRNFQRRMKLYCEFMDQYKSDPYIVNSISYWIDPCIDAYYNFFGTEGCRAVSYREFLLKDRINDFMKTDKMRDAVYETFQVGQKYSSKYIKEKLKEFHNEFGIKATPKATDLEEYYDLKPAQIFTKGKRDRGFLILGEK